MAVSRGEGAGVVEEEGKEGPVHREEGGGVWGEEPAWLEGRSAGEGEEQSVHTHTHTHTHTQELQVTTCRLHTYTCKCTFSTHVCTLESHSSTGVMQPCVLTLMCGLLSSCRPQLSPGTLCRYV